MKLPLELNNQHGIIGIIKMTNFSQLKVSQLPPYLRFVVWASYNDIEIETIYASPEIQEKQKNSGKRNFDGTRYEFTAEFLEIYDIWLKGPNYIRDQSCE